MASDQYPLKDTYSEESIEEFRTREFQLKYKRVFGKFPRDIADYNDDNSYESWEEFQFYRKYFPDSWHEQRIQKIHQERLDAMTDEQRAKELEEEKAIDEAQKQVFIKRYNKNNQTIAEVAELHEESPMSRNYFFKCFPELREKFYELLEKEPNTCMKDLFSD